MVAAVVAGVFHAASISSDCAVDARCGHTVALVVNSDSTSSSDDIAARLASASVDLSGIILGGTSGCVDRAHISIGRKDAGLGREVVAVDNTTGMTVGQRALGQPSARSFGVSSVVDAGVTVIVLVATNIGDDTSAVGLSGVAAADAGVLVATVIANTVGISRTRVS